MPFLNSLRQALTLHFLLVSSVPVLLFALLNIHLLSKQQLEGIRERNMMQVTSASEEVELFLLEVRSDLHQVQKTLESDQIRKPESVDEFLAGVVRNSQFFESIYLLDRNHHVLPLAFLPNLQPRRDDYAMFSTKNFGVGLGLPIIKSILEDHGGGVEYHCSSGKGTTVVMWLPLAHEAWS